MHFFVFFDIFDKLHNFCVLNCHSFSLVKSIPFFSCLLVHLLKHLPALCISDILTYIKLKEARYGDFNSHRDSARSSGDGFYLHTDIAEEI